MTGKQLFTRLQQEGVLPIRNLSGNVVTWETAFVGTKELYLFFATIQGPVTGEGVYNKAVEAGFYGKDLSYHDLAGLSQLIQGFDTIASILSEEVQP